MKPVDDGGDPLCFGHPLGQRILLKGVLEAASAAQCASTIGQYVKNVLFKCDTMLNWTHVESAKWSLAKQLQLLRSHACRSDPTDHVSLVSPSQPQKKSLSQ